MMIAANIRLIDRNADSNAVGRISFYVQKLMRMFYIVLLTFLLYYMTHIPDKLSQPAAQEDK